MSNKNVLAEQPIFDWLKELGYEYAFWPDIVTDSLVAERELFRKVIGDLP